MWALSIATSVPVPMAMPTWARASAGASLIPSPALAPQCIGRFDQRAGVCPEILQERWVADRHGPAVDSAFHTPAGPRPERLGGRDGQPPLPGRGRDRRGQRMLAGQLEAGRQPE